MDESLVDTNVYADVHSNSRVNTDPITPIRRRDHSAVSAIFPFSVPDPYRSAPAVTYDEQEEWRWFVSNIAQTIEEQQRAETDRQPTILHGVRDTHGRRRLRPAVQLPVDRPQNDYDHLLDFRAYSPNNSTRGYWDFDPHEIRRDNTFTPAVIEPPEGQRPWIDFIPPRTPSPLPEPGSLEAMLSGSLADPRPPSPGVPIFANNHFRNNIGIRRHEVRDFTRRFRALPPELRVRVIQRRQQEDLFWMDALRDIESQVWLYNLSPRKREVVYKVQRLHHQAGDDFDDEQRIGAELKQAAQEVLRSCRQSAMTKE